MCGENNVEQDWIAFTRGSSPRVRGKHDLHEGHGPQRGLIPACAGKTVWDAGFTFEGEAHPRVCGENSRRRAPDVEVAGSSPRVRGKRSQRRAMLCAGRLIPACAGKTAVRRGWWCRCGAHPRVCGENSTVAAVHPRIAGSSPRVRGKRRMGRRSRDPDGLIPACAGKTDRHRRAHRRWRAHPRVCGENSMTSTVFGTRAGSSPRVRGKPYMSRPGTAWLGLIPACAGKTPPRTSSASARTAHPRVCGENMWARAFGRAYVGSSPRVRGKRVPMRAAARYPRLIPACAGKTCARVARVRCGQAHPPVCGENYEWHGDGVADHGSSPRVRGKPKDASALVWADRLIPACAGKTPPTARANSSTQAHPRVCGENMSATLATSAPSGSSPRVRGKPKVSF